MRHTRHDKINNISNKEELMRVIEEEMCNMTFDVSGLDFFFQTYSCSVSEILSISHIFCNRCRKDLYIPSRVEDWVQNNSDFFDTDLYFFYKLFKQYPAIVRDIEPYLIEEKKVSDPITDSNATIKIHQPSVDIKNKEVIEKTVYTISVNYEMFDRLLKFNYTNI